MRKTLLVLALLASGLAVAKPASQAGPLLKPAEDQADAAIWASRFLTRFHYKAVPLDDAMSAKMFDAYFDSLDGEKLFFLKSDVERFSAAREQLDDAIFNKDLSMPFAVFNLYLQRVAERTVLIRRQTRIRLPDAIVWASAKCEGALLVSRNSRDFPPGAPDVRMPYVL